jgi:hypothetical protein
MEEDDDTTPTRIPAMMVRPAAHLGHDRRKEEWFTT